MSEPMSRQGLCQCEASKHVEGCFSSATVTIQTEYGRFRVCADCAADYFEGGYGKPIAEAEASS